MDVSATGESVVVESGGETDSYRLELVLKGDRAKIVGAMWCQKLLEPEDDISRWLSSLVVGLTTFEFASKEDMLTMKGSHAN